MVDHSSKVTLAPAYCWASVTLTEVRGTHSYHHNGEISVILFQVINETSK